MYKIKYEEIVKDFLTLNEAFTEYKKLRSLAWWELDQTQLRIYNDDGQDLTQIINDYLDGRDNPRTGFTGLSSGS